MTDAGKSLDLAGLMREHQAGVWRYLRALGADPALADDITQETFLAALRSGFMERSRGETISWLRTTCRNQYLKARHKQGREVATDLIETLDRRFTELVGNEDGAEMVAALRQCLQQLEDKPRQVLEMQHGQNLARLDIATRLGMTDDGVKTLIARTKARLKKCMEARLGSEP